MTLEEYRINKRLSYRALAQRFGTTLNKVFRWSGQDALVKMVDGKRSIVINKVVAQEVK